MAIDKKFKSDAFTRIYDVWARKNPGYEKHYEAEVIKPLTDFARRDGAELIPHLKNGRIQNPDSFGHDPCPPRDMKH